MKSFRRTQVTVHLNIVTDKFIMWIEEGQITQVNLLWRIRGVYSQDKQEHFYYGDKLW